MLYRRRTTACKHRISSFYFPIYDLKLTLGCLQVQNIYILPISVETRPFKQKGLHMIQLFTKIPKRAQKTN
jgi:hypothetical protein